MEQKEFVQLPEWHAIPMIFMTIILLAFSYNIGMMGILAFYAILFAHGYYKKQFVLEPSAKMLVPAIFTGFATISFLWSDYSVDSVYKGAEYISMMLCSYIVFRLVPLKSMIKGTALSCAAILVITLFGGQHGVDALSGGESALIGYFGSKNVVGLFAEIGIISSLFSLFISGRIIFKLAIYIPCLFLSVVCLYLSHSSSSLLSLFAVIAIIAAVLGVRIFPGAVRPVILALGVFAGLTVMVMAMSLNTAVSEKVLSMLGKDSTLTGRTYLWQEGINHGLDKPILGHGYSAFWVVGQPYAERYWEEFFIASKTGFHFHNLFIQTFVDLGAIGLLLVVWMLGKSFVSLLGRAVFKEAGAPQLFLLAISSMLCIRAFVEVDFLGPFGVGCLFFFIAVFYSGRLRVQI